MSEGKVIFLENFKLDVYGGPRKGQGTPFKAYSWLVRCCLVPVSLFSEIAL